MRGGSHYRHLRTRRPQFTQHDSPTPTPSPEPQGEKPSLTGSYAPPSGARLSARQGPQSLVIDVDLKELPPRCTDEQRSAQPAVGYSPKNLVRPQPSIAKKDRASSQTISHAIKRFRVSPPEDATSRSRLDPNQPQVATSACYSAPAVQRVSLVGDPDSHPKVSPSTVLTTGKNTLQPKTSNSSLPFVASSTLSSQHEQSRSTILPKVSRVAGQQTLQLASARPPSHNTFRKPRPPSYQLPANEPPSFPPSRNKDSTSLGRVDRSPPQLRRNSQDASNEMETSTSQLGPPSKIRQPRSSPSGPKRGTESSSGFFSKVAESIGAERRMRCPANSHLEPWAGGPSSTSGKIIRSVPFNQPKSKCEALEQRLDILKQPRCKKQAALPKDVANRTLHADAHATNDLVEVPRLPKIIRDRTPSHNLSTDSSFEVHQEAKKLTDKIDRQGHKQRKRVASAEVDDTEINAINDIDHLHSLKPRRRRARHQKLMADLESEMFADVHYYMSLRRSLRGRTRETFRKIYATSARARAPRFIVPLTLPEIAFRPGRMMTEKNGEPVNAGRSKDCNAKRSSHRNGNRSSSSQGDCPDLLTYPELPDNESPPPETISVTANMRNQRFQQNRASDVLDAETVLAPLRTTLQVARLKPVEGGVNSTNQMKESFESQHLQGHTVADENEALVDQLQALKRQLSKLEKESDLLRMNALLDSEKIDRLNGSIQAVMKSSNVQKRQYDAEINRLERLSVSSHQHSLPTSIAGTPAAQCPLNLGEDIAFKETFQPLQNGDYDLEDKDDALKEALAEMRRNYSALEMERNVAESKYAASMASDRHSQQRLDVLERDAREVIHRAGVFVSGSFGPFGTALQTLRETLDK